MVKYTRCSINKTEVPHTLCFCWQYSIDHNALLLILFFFVYFTCNAWIAPFLVQIWSFTSIVNLTTNDFVNLWYEGNFFLYGADPSIKFPIPTQNMLLGSLFCYLYIYLSKNFNSNLLKIWRLINYVCCYKIWS